MNRDICWIDVVEEAEATGTLASSYASLKRDDGTIHNLYKAFSQFPEPVVTADRFYRDIMHSPQAPLPMWLAELLSVDVAIVNKCNYAATHHGANFLHLYGDRKVGEEMINALRAGDFGPEHFDAKLAELLRFGRKLSVDADKMIQEDISSLRKAGYSDAEISQAIQVTASFAYWTRLINALGISLGEEKIGKY